MATPLTAEQLHQRLESLTVIDVRSPGEFDSGHIADSLNIPLDQLQHAVPSLRTAAQRGTLAVVCAAGVRSQTAGTQLDTEGISAVTLIGGTDAWIKQGYPLKRSAGAKVVWAMDRQVRFTAGTLVLFGLVLDILLPGARWFSAVIAGALTFTALANTCPMGMLLAKLPHNRVGGTSRLEEALDALQR